MNIYRRPANEFVADFVGRINFIEGSADDGRIEFSESQSIFCSGRKRGHVVIGIRPENVTLYDDEMRPVTE